jgi:queuine tRNA-ribosyltransferase
MPDSDIRGNLKFEIIACDSSNRARTGLLHTPHGVIETPAFMPVGTAATIKGLTQDQLENLGVQILLANTYHLYLRPGHEIVREAGGLHGFMSWPHPILTDSGGFQVMSLRELRRLSEDGVWFRSHLDGASHFLSPERAIEIQLALGADIIMVLDQCIEYPSSYQATRRAGDLTGRWARRAKEYYAKAWNARPPESQGRLGAPTDPVPRAGNPSHVPALFGIVQGGIEKNLRLQSAEEIISIGFEGYAVGGLAVGEPKAEMYEMAEYTAGLLPLDGPRYLMGVGTPRDLVECVAHGFDMFDCVMPTRNARNAMAFTSEGRVAIRNSRYAHDEKPLDPACECPTCARYSRRYLRHLFHAGEMLGPILATQHNVYFYLDSMRRIREAIGSGTFEGLLSRVRAGDPDGIPSS